MDHRSQPPGGKRLKINPPQRREERKEKLMRIKHQKSLRSLRLCGENVLSKIIQACLDEKS
jgi:hypothetical protein